MGKNRYRCERNLKKVRKEPCAGCGMSPSEAAHIKSKGAGGGDYEYNVLPLCHSCHRSIQHGKGWSELIEKRPFVRVALRARGWMWEEVHGRFVMWNPEADSVLRKFN